MQVFLDPLTAGDAKPVGVLVNPSDRAHVLSGTWSLVQADTGDPIPAGNVLPVSGAIVVDAQNDGSLITTDNPIRWLTAGQYVCRFSFTWSDGEVDNTLSAKITVQPPAT